MSGRGTLSATTALVAVITAVFAVVAWAGVEQFRSSGGDDEVAYRAFVDELYAAHHLPTPSENVEYALPPGVPALGVALNWAFEPITPDRPSPILQNLPRLLRRLLWLALVAAGASLIARAPRLSRVGSLAPERGSLPLRGRGRTSVLPPTTNRGCRLC